MIQIPACSILTETLPVLAQQSMWGMLIIEFFHCPEPYRRHQWGIWFFLFPWGHLPVINKSLCGYVDYSQLDGIQKSRWHTFGSRFISVAPVIHWLADDSTACSQPIKPQIKLMTQWIRREVVANRALFKRFLTPSSMTGDELLKIYATVSTQGEKWMEVLPVRSRLPSCLHPLSGVEGHRVESTVH